MDGKKQKKTQMKESNIDNNILNHEIPLKEIEGSRFACLSNIVLAFMLQFL